MNLFIKSIESNKVINSYNFARNSDIVFSETVSKSQYEKLKSEDTVVVEESNNSVLYMLKAFDLKENSIIFTNTYLINDLFRSLKNSKFRNIKIISTQTDHSIEYRDFNKKPSCVSKWFSTNVVFQHKDLVPIPLGLANEYSPKNIQKKDYEKLQVSDIKINELYVNFENNTNYFHRNKIKKNLLKKENTFIEQEKLSIADYLEKLNKYQFILCPFGNGFDTHRIWETLYAGSIPIIPKQFSLESIFETDLFLFENLKSLSSYKYKAYIKENMQSFDYLLNIDYWLGKIFENKLKNNFQVEKVSLSSISIINNYFIFKKKEEMRKKRQTLYRKVHNKVFN